MRVGVGVRVRVRFTLTATSGMRTFCAGLESTGATKAPPWVEADDSAMGTFTGSGRGAASAQPVDGCCSYGIAPLLYDATPPLS